ncbi:uncharacterized protein [Coffea arabica]|uniref:Uncharacterized protein n=1 Tax=Coffea arabica TaxID=13443 RepID=A0ABM4X0E6_COFAR
MEAGSTTATNRLSKAFVAENNTTKLVKSSKRASLSKERKKAGILQDKSFKKDLDRMRISRSGSENVAFDNSVREFGLESIVDTSNAPLHTNPVILVGHEEDRDGQFNDQDVEEKPKTNTFRLNEPAKIPGIPQQERYLDLKARVKELRKENHRLYRQLQGEAEFSLQLKEENRILLDELKRKCGPDIISSLEAENPDQTAQSTDS